MKFSRQEYWSGWPFPSPGDLPNPGIEPRSPANGKMLYRLSHQGNPKTPNNWCFCTVVLEKTLENALDCKDIKSVNPKGYQFWIFIGRTDSEAEAPILWPLDAKTDFTSLYYVFLFLHCKWHPKISIIKFDNKHDSSKSSMNWKKMKILISLNKSYTPFFWFLNRNSS